MKFEKIQAGQTLFDVHSYRTGNTTLRSVGVWPVKILSVHPESRTAMVSWNGNGPERMYEASLAKLRAKEPELEKGFMGQYRIKRKPRKV